MENNALDPKNFDKGVEHGKKLAQSDIIKLIEGHKIPKWASTQTIEGYEYAKKEFIDLLTKYKNTLK